LRQAIWRKTEASWQICGIPDVLNTDNGRDFTSQHLEQTAAELKIRLVFSTPGLPRGRGRIERFFSTLTKSFLCNLSGYAPSGGAVRGKPEIKIAKLDCLLRNFLLEDYHRRKHSETEVAPSERWEARGFLPRMPESLEQLDLLLLTVPEARVIHQDGIRFQGLRFVDPTLAAYVGEEVILRYDPRDMTEIRVFHDQRFLCRAICPELAGEVVSLREIVRARNQQRRGLRSILRDRRKTLDSLFELKRGEATQKPKTAAVNKKEKREPTRRLKRYFNDE
jgi:putative transposase